MRRAVVALVAWAALAATLVQYMAADPEGAAFSTAVDRLEGRQWLCPDGGCALAVASSQRFVVLRVLGSPATGAVVLVDGRPIARLRSARTTVPVAPGQLIEIDGSLYRRPVVVRVEATGPDIRSPARGHVAVAVGDIAVVGRVAVAPSPGSWLQPPQKPPDQGAEGGPGDGQGQ